MPQRYAQDLVIGTLYVFQCDEDRDTWITEAPALRKKLNPEQYADKLKQRPGMVGRYGFGWK